MSANSPGNQSRTHRTNGSLIRDAKGSAAGSTSRTAAILPDNCVVPNREVNIPRRSTARADAGRMAHAAGSVIWKTRLTAAGARPDNRAGRHSGAALRLEPGGDFCPHRCRPPSEALLRAIRVDRRRSWVALEPARVANRRRGAIHAREQLQRRHQRWVIRGGDETAGRGGDPRKWRRVGTSHRTESALDPGPRGTLFRRRCAWFGSRRPGPGMMWSAAKSCPRVQRIDVIHAGKALEVLVLSEERRTAVDGHGGEMRIRPQVAGSACHAEQIAQDWPVANPWHKQIDGRLVQPGPARADRLVPVQGAGKNPRTHGDAKKRQQASPRSTDGGRAGQGFLQPSRRRRNRSGPRRAHGGSTPISGPGHSVQASAAG